MGRMCKLAIAVAAAALTLPAAADEVIVKTIDPDKPPAAATRPDQPARPVGPTHPADPRVWTVPAIVGGDWVVQHALRTANVTDEQKAKLKPVLDEMAAGAKAEQAKSAELSARIQAAYKAARDGGKDLAKDPEIKALNEEMARQWSEASRSAEKRREQLLAALDGVLSAEQVRAVRDLFDRYSSNVTVRNRSLARDWLKTSYPGVSLSADQQDQIMAKVAPIQEKFGQQFADLQKAQGEKMQQLAKEDPKTAWQKAQGEFAPKFEELRVGLSKAMNEAIEATFTDEQKKQAAGGRQEAWKKSVQDWVDATVRSFEAVKPTDDQKAKIKELAAAAGGAMLKTDMYDAAGRNELAARLREDIKKLLTEEQRKLVR